jgi:hypothetical protein
METRDDTYHVDEINDKYDDHGYNIITFRKNLECRSNFLKMIVADFAVNLTNGKNRSNKQ